MKIAYVVHDFSRGFGQGRYTFELARRFARDHDVHVFANVIDPAGADGVHFHRVRAIRSNALATILSFAVPSTLHLGGAWDVIHAQGFTSLRFNVITAHICNARWAEAQRTMQVARTWRQRVFERIVPPIEHACYAFSPNAEVIAISDQVRRELGESYGRTSRVSVIHHGVDPVDFSPRRRTSLRDPMRGELGLDSAFAALFIGDLRKGAVAAMRVATMVPELRLILVSRSDPEPFAAHARELGIEPRVLFRPATKEIARYYAAADAFLFPSPYDAYGMVVSEAMAMGLPCIVSTLAGASEIVRQGETGFVVDPGDVDAMAMHLKTLIDDPVQAGAIGRAASEATAGDTWDDVARRTMRIYERAAPLR